MVVIVSSGVGLGHKDCDGYRDRLRTARVLWWLQQLKEDGKGGFYGHWGRLRTQRLS